MASLATQKRGLKSCSSLFINRGGVSLCECQFALVSRLTIDLGGRGRGGGGDLDL